MIEKFSSPSEMLVGLGEIVTPIFSKAGELAKESRPYRYVRGLPFVRACAGAYSLVSNPEQVFPENKFHDDNKIKQDYF